MGDVLRATIAGSLPKPAWLAEPETLWAPWRLPPETLLEGQRDAVILALRDQEEAGIDVVTDGEQTRRHFVHGFAERLEGIDPSRRTRIGIRGDRYVAEVPTVVGPVRRAGSETVCRLALAERLLSSIVSKSFAMGVPRGLSSSRKGLDYSAMTLRLRPPLLAA